MRCVGRVDADNNVVEPKSDSFSALMISSRAAAFSLCATASSRSRKTSSASSVGALARKRSLEPERRGHVRRGRCIPV